MPRFPTTAAPAAALALALCAAPAASQAAAPFPGPPLDRANMDTTCHPCKNFFQFANGGWLRNNPVPDAYSSWSSFNELAERNQAQLREVVESAMRQAATTTDPNTRRLGEFYGACMDSTAVEAAGLSPIAGDLRRIEGIRTRDDLRAEIARMHAEGGSVLFSMSSSPDPRNSARMIASTWQGGLGLPNRDYYFRDDSATRALQATYVEHVAKMLELAGAPAAEARADAERVYALEKALAEASRTPVQLRDPNARVNPRSVAALEEEAPGFGWRAYFDALGLQRVDSVNVGQPEFLARVGREVGERPLEDWRAYLRTRILTGSANWLSSPFANQQFAYARALSGAREMQPRWRRCLALTDGVLGDALGQEYVKTNFSPEAKARMLEMVGNLRTVFRQRLGELAWMSGETKPKALTKLGTTVDKIGYPDEWETYEGLEVAPGALFANLRSAQRWERAKDLEKIGQPTDRTEWFMTAPTVNAYYNPTTNEIGFPAGRLQPPFFHVTFDEGANYGGIGGTIGHEMTHGFDDQGRHYDHEGNLSGWWNEEDSRRFTELADKVVEQYNGYTVLDSLHLNGRLTLGENIADLGGMKIAYYALQMALEGKSREPIDGFTPEQRFFLAYAQARRGHYRPEALRLQVQNGVHSPVEFRVNGPLSNMPEFWEAFGCKPGDPMVRAEPIVIW